MWESDICQTPMLLLIKSGGSLLPAGTHVSHTSRQLGPSLVPQPWSLCLLSPTTTPALDTSFPFQTQWAAEGGKGPNTDFFFFC